MGPVPVLLFTHLHHATTIPATDSQRAFAPPWSDGEPFTGRVSPPTRCAAIDLTHLSFPLSPSFPNTPRHLMRNMSLRHLISVAARFPHLSIGSRSSATGRCSISTRNQRSAAEETRLNVIGTRMSTIRRPLLLLSPPLSLSPHPPPTHAPSKPRPS